MSKANKGNLRGKREATNAKAIQYVKKEAARALTRIRRSTAAAARRQLSATRERMAAIYRREVPAAIQFPWDAPAPAAPAGYHAGFDQIDELPQSHGTGAIHFSARDPHWFFATWDWSLEQLRSRIGQAGDGKLWLQIYTPTGNKVQQIEVDPTAKSWFVQMGMPGSVFYAEMGIYTSTGQWEVLGRSAEARAPRDYVSQRVDAHYATVPMSFSLRQLLEMILGDLLPGETLVGALARMQSKGFVFPFAIESDMEISEEKQQMLLGYLSGELTRRINMGSFEITELIRRRLAEQLSSGVTSRFGQVGVGLGMGSESVSSFSLAGSSPMGASFGAPQSAGERGFFMHVNAELIIYGGTDPNATVHVGGKRIELRPDGTFSYHFILPDGRYHIPVEATSPDQVETRGALLSFLRLSDYTGQVDATGQPPHLTHPLGRVD